MAISGFPETESVKDGLSNGKNDLIPDVLGLSPGGNSVSIRNDLQLLQYRASELRTSSLNRLARVFIFRGFQLSENSLFLWSRLLLLIPIHTG